MANRFDSLRQDYGVLPRSLGSVNQRALKYELEGERRLKGSLSKKVLHAIERRDRQLSGGEPGSIESVGIPSSLTVFPESIDVARELYDQRLQEISVGLTEARTEPVLPVSRDYFPIKSTIFQRLKGRIVDIVSRIS
ncbi:MAG: hypothetical protein Q8Q49_05755 [bacterium]|nr:hypothetical protein [bacterium]